MVGRTVLHYQILETLGRGGTGLVYKARDTHLDRFVAIKVLPPEKVADPERKRRFVQEAKAASALSHPNIVHIYDIAGGRDPVHRHGNVLRYSRFSCVLCNGGSHSVPVWPPSDAPRTRANEEGFRIAFAVRTPLNQDFSDVKPIRQVAIRFLHPVDLTVWRPRSHFLRPDDTRYKTTPFVATCLCIHPHHRDSETAVRRALCPCRAASTRSATNIRATPTRHS